MVEQDKANYQRALDTYVGLVKRTASMSAGVGRTILLPVVWGMEAPAKLRPRIEKRIRAERPLSEAKIAVDSIVRGKAHGDKDLVGHGVTMLTKAVQKADTSRYVSEQVTEEVAEMARFVHLDPTEAYIDPFTIKNVQDVLEKYNPE